MGLFAFVAAEARDAAHEGNKSPPKKDPNLHEVASFEHDSLVFSYRIFGSEVAGADTASPSEAVGGRSEEPDPGGGMGEALDKGGNCFEGLDAMQDGREHVQEH